MDYPVVMDPGAHTVLTTHHEIPAAMEPSQTLDVPLWYDEQIQNGLPGSDLVWRRLPAPAEKR